MSQTTQVVVVAALVGLVIWFIKQFLQNYFTTKIDITYGNLIKLQHEFDEHKDECDDIPKKVVIERINHLSDRVEDIKRDIRDIRQEINEHDKLVDLKFQDLSFAISKIVRNPSNIT